SSATTLSIYGVQHTPLVLTRSGSSENVSIGFKLDNMNPKYLGIDTNGDLAFGESPDQKQNSKLITQAKLDKGLTIGGQLAFGNDSNLLIVFYVQIMPDDFVMQLHRF
ncbi:TPA: hypothetical protein ACPZIW_004596, partial [Escherichia coli]